MLLIKTDSMWSINIEESNRYNPKTGGSLITDGHIHWLDFMEN